MIWFILASMALTVLLILWLGRSSISVSDDPVDHFRAQLKEIDTDIKNGVLEPEAAEAARLEIQRRMLRANKIQATAENMGGIADISEGQNAQISKPALALGGFLIVAASFGLYMLLGAPGVPSAAKSVRTQAQEQEIEEGGPTFGEAIAQVQAHLAVNPRDMRGWEVLGKSAGAVGDYALAAQAYGELARMNPDVPDWRVQEFEAYMAHASGQITPAARLVLAALMDAEPNHPAGQFYVGLTQLQAGNEAGAKAIWLALADRSMPDAPWMPLVRRQLASLGVTPPKLSNEDVEAVDAMTAQEREVFIQSMMERLRQRLESSPDDPEGWAMLARSQLAMGDKSGAIETLKRGISEVSDQNSADLQAFLDNLLTNNDL